MAPTRATGQNTTITCQHKQNEYGSYSCHQSIYFKAFKNMTLYSILSFFSCKSVKLCVWFLGIIPNQGNLSRRRTVDTESDSRARVKTETNGGSASGLYAPQSVKRIGEVISNHSSSIVQHKGYDKLIYKITLN
jgi:hypothetical protein